MVEEITIKGKKMPLRVSYLAIKKTKNEVLAKRTDKQDVSMEEIMSGDIELMEPLLYYALLSGAKAVDAEFKYARDEAEYLLDECFFEFLELLPKFFPTDIKEGKKSGKRSSPRKG